MRLSVAIAGAMVMLAFLTACEFKSPADRVNEAVDELIEDSVEDVFGTPTPQSGGVRLHRLAMRLQRLLPAPQNQRLSRREIQVLPPRLSRW